MYQKNYRDTKIHNHSNVFGENILFGKHTYRYTTYSSRSISQYLILPYLSNSRLNNYTQSEPILLPCDNCDKKIKRKKRLKKPRKKASKRRVINTRLTCVTLSLTTWLPPTLGTTRETAEQSQW